MLRKVFYSVTFAVLTAFFAFPPWAAAARSAPGQKAEAKTSALRQCLKDNRVAVSAFRDAVRAAARAREETLRAATLRYRADVVSALRQFQSSLRNGVDAKGRKAVQERYQVAIKAAREALSLAPKRARETYQASVRAAEDSKKKATKDCS